MHQALFVIRQNLLSVVNCQLLSSNFQQLIVEKDMSISSSHLGNGACYCDGKPPAV
jgi:hypothetical protein